MGAAASMPPGTNLSAETMTALEALPQAAKDELMAKLDLAKADSKETTDKAEAAMKASSVDLVSIFKNFDTDGNGWLDLGELKRTFRALGLKKRDGAKLEIDQETFKSFDTNGDGKISIAEFVANLKEKTRLKIEELVAAGWKFDPEAWAASKERHKVWNMAKVFAAFDKEGKGVLSMEAFQRAFRALGLKKRGGEDMAIDKAMFDSFDTNKDGKVSLLEFQTNLLEKTRKKIEEKLDGGWKFDAEEWGKADDGGTVSAEVASAEKPKEAAADATKVSEEAAAKKA